MPDPDFAGQTANLVLFTTQRCAYNVASHALHANQGRTHPQKSVWVSEILKGKSLLL